MNHLVIVESPAKGRTIERYLGSDFTVAASFGHVRDLPKSELGVDVEHDFKPSYQIIPKSAKTIAKLKDLAKAAQDVYLATDLDREGEAIAWHVARALGLSDGQELADKSQSIKAGRHGKTGSMNKPVHRITFTEITKGAIQESIKNPRSINLNLVNAQQARRVLDRLVGYKLSPFLWKKVLGGLSAGRVQSVAVRLIVDREREIESFVPIKYWSVLALGQKSGVDFEAFLIKIGDRELARQEIDSKTKADTIVKDLAGSLLRLESRVQDNIERWAFPPFTTSTLQQDASRKFGFWAKKTMKLAQQLYESGLITYHRTDSTNLSWLAINVTRNYIAKHFDSAYSLAKPRVFKTKSAGAQEAHEAIRPTYIDRESVVDQAKRAGKLTQDHQQLYHLIRTRTLACQMAPALISTTVAEFETTGKSNQSYRFQATGQRLVFDGFTKIYPVEFKQVTLPEFKPNESIRPERYQARQHETKPPFRYSEASLIKILEEKGIGRPSTYAPIISTIQDRGYVTLQGRFFIPNKVGTLVTDLLVEHFPTVVDVGFTADLENRLDQIARGKQDWVATVRQFYIPFEKTLEHKLASVKQHTFEEASEQVCPKCGQPMIVRSGRFGLFLGCSTYPKCKGIRSIRQGTGVTCPECGQGELIEKRTRKGRLFWACERYPDCKHATWVKPIQPNLVRSQSQVEAFQSSNVKVQKPNQTQNSKSKK